MNKIYKLIDNIKMMRTIATSNHSKRRSSPKKKKIPSEPSRPSSISTSPVKFADEYRRKVDFKDLKYNLDDLFNNTPVFDTPVFDFTEHHPYKSWTMIANAIFDPFGKINEYVARMK